MTVALIVAAAGKNLVIGKGNDLPWHFSADLKYFKEKTMGCPVVMGRKTYQSILQRLGKPLPGRQSIVLTRDKNFQDDRAMVIHNVSEITKLADKDKTLFIIGGAEVFKQTINLADMLYMTYIDQEIEGDTYFPQLATNKWKLTDEHKTTENGVTLRFCRYRKI